VRQRRAGVASARKACAPAQAPRDLPNAAGAAHVSQAPGSCQGVALRMTLRNTPSISSRTRHRGRGAERLVVGRWAQPEDLQVGHFCAGRYARTCARSSEASVWGVACVCERGVGHAVRRGGAYAPNMSSGGSHDSWHSGSMLTGRGTLVPFLKHAAAAPSACRFCSGTCTHNCARNCVGSAGVRVSEMWRARAREISCAACGVGAPRPRGQPALCTAPV
jgi:hypothetical protein